MNKVMKISKVLNTIAGIARMLLKVAAIVTAVAVVIVMFVSGSNDIWADVDYTLHLGQLTLELIPDGMIAPESVRLMLLGSLVLAVPLFLLAAKWLGIVQGILSPMSEGKPFDSRVSDSLRKLSFITLITGFIGQSANMGLTALELSNVRLDTLFNSARVANHTVTMEMDMGFLLVFGVLYLMSYVFRYGEELQALSDETL